MSSSTNSQNRLLTVGSMAFDSISTPTGKADQILGGSVNYFSIAASHFSPVSIVAVVGDDFPQSHLDWLYNRGIDIQGVEKTHGKTFHWTGRYQGNLNEAETLSTQLNVFEHFSPKLSPSLCDISHVFLANIDPVLQLDVLAQMKQPKFVACDTMNFWIAGKRDELLNVFHQVDLVSLNEGELKLLTGHSNLPLGAMKLQEMGPKIVVVKRGEYGAAVFFGSEVFLLPAFLVAEVVDPTGAGDSFAGAFLGYLAKAGFSRELAEKNKTEALKVLKDGMVNGCVMASFTVEDFGIRRISEIAASDFERRRREFTRMIQVG